MVEVHQTDNFESLPLPEKFSFLQTSFETVANSLEERELNRFLKQIILNQSENSYLEGIRNFV